VLGSHVAPGSFAATDGLQHAFAFLAASLLFGRRLCELLLECGRALGVCVWLA
jgi:hypothetical protein